MTRAAAPRTRLPHRRHALPHGQQTEHKGYIMKTSITHAPDKGAMRAGRLGALGLALALAGLFTTAPVQAEDVHHGGQQHGERQGHGAPRQAYRHDDHRRDGHSYGGDQGYAYGAPPIVYAPQEAPGISLFLPL